MMKQRANYKTWVWKICRFQREECITMHWLAEWTGLRAWRLACWRSTRAPKAIASSALKCSKHFSSILTCFMAAVSACCHLSPEFRNARFLHIITEEGSGGGGMLCSALPSKVPFAIKTLCQFVCLYVCLFICSLFIDSRNQRGPERISTKNFLFLK